MYLNVLCLFACFLHLSITIFADARNPCMSVRTKESMRAELGEPGVPGRITTVCTALSTVLLCTDTVWTAVLTRRQRRLDLGWALVSKEV